jgi:hypothetical protein
MNKLQDMWDQQKSFMDLLREHRNFPAFPVDTTTKSGQKILKSITHECMHELFEANLLLKNSKEHRATNICEFDRENYVEELADVLHYFFEIAILSGISLEELYSTYMKKGETNIVRIKEGY